MISKNLYGEDWDSGCEGCGKRPSLCSCKEDSKRENLINCFFYIGMLTVVVVAIILSIL